MPFTDANGIQHYYEILGNINATPLILIAGMGGASSFWRPQLDKLSKHYCVIIYDQRGTGQTTRTQVESIGQLADDLNALMENLKIHSAHLVGHSTGGAVAMTLAHKYPDRIKSLFLYASIHRVDAYRKRIWTLRKKILSELGALIYAQTTSLFFYPPEFIANHSKYLEEIELITAKKDLSDKQIMHSRINSILNFEFIEHLKQIKKPTFVFFYIVDMLTPYYFSSEFAFLILNIQLTLFY